MVQLVQQPSSLESMAVKTLGPWLASQASKLASSTDLRQRPPTDADDLISSQIAATRDYIQRKIPGTFYNKIAIEAIRALEDLFHETNIFLRFSLTDYRHVSPGNVIGRMIEALFTRNLTSLTFKEKTWIIFQDSLLSKWPTLPQLTSLELCEPKVGDVIGLFQNLPNLKNLKLHFVCTDSVLKSIADNCKLMETLDISCNNNVTDGSMDIVSQMRNLKRVDVEATAVTKQGVVTLLMSCDNIEHIGALMYLNSKYVYVVGCALEDVAAVEEHADKKFKLKYYENDDNTTMQQVNSVVKMCPLIQKVILLKHDDSQSYLEPFNGLQDLRDVDLWGYEFNADRVREFLQVRGNNLVLLKLGFFRQLTLNELMHICEMCPNLEMLAIKYLDWWVEGLDHVIVSKAEIPPLRHLKRLTLSCLPDEHIIFLLSKCPSVEVIDLREAVKLSENVILEVLDKNPTGLTHLKQLILRDVLPVFVIDRIVENCVTPPQVVATHAVTR